MTISIKCPWCDEVVVLGEDVAQDFEFKFVPTWNHPKSACCNLCEAEILEPCELEKVGDEDDEYEY